MTRTTTSTKSNGSPLASLTRCCFMAAATMVAAATCANSASADQIGRVTSGAWKGGAFTNKATGAFSHCAANARYKSGVALFFSITRTRQWSMGLANNHWELKPGHKYPVRFQVDNGPVMTGMAVAKSQRLVQVHLPPKDRMFQHFKAGGTLTVAAGKKVMRFSLTGTGPMLSKLYKCASHYARNHRAGPVHSAGRESDRPATDHKVYVPGRTFF